MTTRFTTVLALGLSVLLFSSCSKKEQDRTASGLAKVSIQTDWYAQAEHGGFYQAAAKGFYRDNGIETDILQGGPSVHILETVATGRVTFGIGRSDDVINSVSRGIPIVMVGALMQHDPQALLLHAENPIERFEDLDGKSIMAAPGSTFIEFLQNRYKIKLHIVPLNFGLARFMADKDFIQQCFVTNEPFYVKKGGANPKTLLLANSGFEPYRVIFTSRAFAKAHPEVVKAFVAASIKGWEDYLTGDSNAANEMILKKNENMTADLLTYATAQLRDLGLVAGKPEKGEAVGLLKVSRLEEQVATMRELKMLERVPAMEEYVSFDFLPDDLKARSGK